MTLAWREEKNSCKNAREAHVNSGEANHAQQTKTANCSGYWVSVPLLPYISKFLQFHEILLKIKLHQCSTLIAAFLGACKPWGKGKIVSRLS